MFNKPTAFILGAGASWHYNYPTGEDFVKRIIEKTDIIIKCFENENNNNHVAQSSEMPNFFSEKFGDAEPGHAKILDFLRDFVQRLKQVDPPVIDYFLDWNEDLQGIGTLIIAWVILDRERQYISGDFSNYNHKLHFLESPFETSPIRDLKNFKDNWYKFILYKMVSGCKKAASLKNNNIRFITFNYDVSLETYLYRGLKAIQLLNTDTHSIDKFLKNRFVHMYGQIRDDHFSQFDLLPKSPADKRIRFYKAILDLAYNASKGIRPIGSSDKDNHEAMTEAREIIEWAEDIYILGYGFDENNNRRLHLPSLLTPAAIRDQCRISDKPINKSVYFTNFLDANSVNKKAGKLFASDPAIFLNSYVYKRDGYRGDKDWSISYEKSTRNVYDALNKDFNVI